MIGVAVRDVLEPMERLDRDLREASASLDVVEVRYLVDAYYAMQEQRIRAGNQLRAMNREPHRIILWYEANAAMLEQQVRRALQAYAESQPVGRWALAQVGIGPVITAGLLAHIEITKAPTVGHIWRFAGLDPTVTWARAQKRPWNARLKTLCWKIGESFKKTSNHEQSVYGKVYRDRKAQEVERNAAGVFADQAAATLAARPTHKQRAIYTEGQLPDGRLDMRAMRYAVKLFLSGYHEAAYFSQYGVLPPKPYVIEHLGHAHYVAPPHMEIIPGWSEAHRR